MEPVDSNDKIKILYICTWMKIGGAERQLSELIRNLDKKRFHPVLLTLREKGHFYDILEAEGIEVYCLGERPGLNLKFFSSMWKTINLIRKGKFHVIQSMEFNAQTIGRLAALVTGTPVSIVADHYTGHWEESKYKKYVNKILLGVTDRIIFVASNQKMSNCEEESIPPEKGVVIYNGVDPEIFRFRGKSKEMISEFGMDDDELAVGIVAAIRPEKAHAVFLEAAARVLRNHPKTRFFVIGDGPARPDIESIASKLGIRNRTTFTGFRGDVQDILAVLDLVVLSSYPKVESFPMSILEAMGMGKAVVATSVSGLPELVKDGKTGYLVPHSDPEALAGAISRLLADRDLRERFGAEGRKRLVQKFTIEKMTRETEDLYITLLEEKSRLPAYFSG